MHRPEPPKRSVKKSGLRISGMPTGSAISTSNRLHGGTRRIGINTSIATKAYSSMTPEQLKGMAKRHINKIDKRPHTMLREGATPRGVTQNSALHQRRFEAAVHKVLTDPRVKNKTQAMNMMADTWAQQAPRFGDSNAMLAASQDIAKKHKLGEFHR